VQSELGRGTCFIIRLPLKVQQNDKKDADEVDPGA